jgi:peptide-methionine (S)-S-oxide reductase
MYKSIVLSILFSSMALSACLQDNGKKINMSSDKALSELQDKNYETATLGAGCFWCVEAIFQDLRGVERVESGFSGGHVKNPAYREVVNGTTGHAEVCNIIFDPDTISFKELLEVFWTTHDPTTLNRQGNDVGTQYRSAIFYHDDEQKMIAEKSKKEIAPQIWDDPIVTEISPFEAFYPAENYHQDYFNLNPNQGYCRVVIAPKVAKFRKKFADKLKD